MSTAARLNSLGMSELEEESQVNMKTYLGVRYVPLFKVQVEHLEEEDQPPQGCNQVWL